MSAATRKCASAPGLLENAAWLSGASLLCVYLGAQIWLWRDREAALEAFSAEQAFAQQAIAQQAMRTGERPPADSRVEAAAPQPLFAAPANPDTRSWSASRIASFAAAVHEGAAHDGAAHEGAAPAAVLRIGAVDLVAPIYGGVNERNLNRGVAWIEGTAALGAAGNIGLAAHRDGYFRALKDVQIGDAIDITTGDEQLSYRIVDLRIVAPNAVEVLAPTAHDALTLVTCYPFYFVGSAPQRFIVRAERI